MWFHKDELKERMEKVRSNRTQESFKQIGETNKERYGEDYYKRIGAMGGKKGRTGGFYGNREAARIAGAKGGRISRRTK